MSQFDETMSAFADKMHPSPAAKPGKGNMRTVRPSSAEGRDVDSGGGVFASPRVGRPGTDVTTEKVAVARRGKLALKQTEDPQPYTRGTRGKQVYAK